MKIENIKHSLSHLLAMAVLKKFPDAQLGIGPVIENGFYYDFLLPRSLTPEDLKDFEKEIKKLIYQKLSFADKKITVAEAKRIFKDQPFKLELINEYTKEKKPLSIYKTGDVFVDLCAGGHVKNSGEINVDAFKLTSIAGAYWRGDEKNPQLQRIYGVAFETKKELEKHLKMMEEAEKRDHKKLGPKLELFMFHKTAPGMPYWLPKGLIIINELINFWRKEHTARGYYEIKSPLINKKELYETSGHWKHYRESMFISKTEEKENYALKPMNCPNAMVVFANKQKSYRELPLRLSDTDTLHRYERSGTLNGLFRVREFSQDDAHIFVSEDQIKDEYERILEITERFYSIFGIEYSFRLGTKPKEFMGDIKTWNRAERWLEEILKKSGKKYLMEKEEGAFYGPKIDILMKDSLGREWQTGTIQLDFQIPKRFGLTYIDKDGKKKIPAVIHRVIYGSLERFVGILIEHYAGAFPLWLSPVQIKILPVGSRHEKYAQKTCAEFLKNNIRAEINNANETVGKKIRGAELEKVPYILVVGDKEIRNKTVNVRHYRRDLEGEMKIEKLVGKIRKEITEKII